MLFSCSVAQSSLTFPDPMVCRTPGFPVLHHLLEQMNDQCKWLGHIGSLTLFPFRVHYEFLIKHAHLVFVLQVQRMVIRLFSA